MPGLYSSGDWHVTPGSEQAFIDAWREFAEWTAATIPGGSFAKLLQDKADPGHFISLGPWRDEGAMSAWRAHPGFKDRAVQIQALLVSFAPHSWHLAAEIGPATPDPW